MKTNVYKKVIAPAVLATSVLLGATPALAYDVKQGDTLGDIADKHNVDLNTLISMNPQIENPNLIYIGDNVRTSGYNQVNHTHNVNTEVSVDIDGYDEMLLARLVEAEAKAEPFAGKVAVARVVINRVNSEQFPNSIEEVIYQQGQFVPASTGAINRPASEESKRAVLEAMKGDNTGGALFFYNPRTATNRWLDTQTTTTVIGNHTFKK